MYIVIDAKEAFSIALIDSRCIEFIWRTNERFNLRNSFNLQGCSGFFLRSSHTHLNFLSRCWSMVKGHKLFILTLLFGTPCPLYSLLGQNHTDSVTNLIDQGRHFYYSHNYAQALPLHKQALAMKPNSVEALLELGWTLFDMGEYLGSLEATNEGTYYPSNLTENLYALISLNYYFNLGLATNDFEFSRRTEEEIEQYKEYSRKRPDGHDRFLRLGITYISHGDTANGFESIYQSIRLRPDFPQAHLMLAKLYDRSNMKKEAAMAYALSLFHHNRVPYARRSITLLENTLFGNGGPDAYESPSIQPSGKITAFSEALSHVIESYSSEHKQAMNYYVPWFRGIRGNDLFEPFVRYIYTGANVPANESWLAENRNSIDSLLSYAKTYQWPAVDTVSAITSSQTGNGSD